MLSIMASLSLHNPNNLSTGTRQLQESPAVAGSVVRENSLLAAKAAERDWSAITAGMANGDAECFQVFHDAIFDLMFREARRLLGRDEHTCLDIVQDALLKTIRTIRPMDSLGQLQQWTRVVVRTTALDWLRKKQRRRESLADPAAEPAAGPDAESATIEQARMAWIEEQLRETAPEIRQLLSLRYRMGWTLQKIAGHFGLKPGAVDGRIRRAVEELKKQARLESSEL